MQSKIETEQSISMAHFVHTDPKSKCFRLHGHTWTVKVVMRGEICDDGMVVDFSDLKAVINELDHKIVVAAGLLNNEGKAKVWPETGDVKLHETEHDTTAIMTIADKGFKYYEIPTEDLFVFPMAFGAVTSENIARYFVMRFARLLAQRSEYEYWVHVDVWEGPKSFASFELHSSTFEEVV